MEVINYVNVVECHKSTSDEEDSYDRSERGRTYQIISRYIH